MERVFKVLVVGRFRTGKTCLIRRYVSDQFSDDYAQTIGVDFALKIIDWTPHEKVRLHLWDLAGQDRFVGLTHVYYRGADAAIVAFDVTREESLQVAAKWKRDVDAKVRLPDGSPLPCILVGNMCDLVEQRAVSDEEIARFAEAEGFLSWFLTSAKTGEGVRAAIESLIGEMTHNDRSPSSTRTSVSLDDDKRPSGWCGSC
eukprot:Opistho-1_new@29780